MHLSTKHSCFASEFERILERRLLNITWSNKGNGYDLESPRRPSFASSMLLHENVLRRSVVGL